MAAATLGPAGASAVNAAYLALSYALLVAYSSKAGDLVALLGGALAPEAAEVALTAAFFGLLLSGTHTCGSGASHRMSRWHFDSCRYRRAQCKESSESTGVKECKLGTLHAGGERLVEAANMGLTGLLLLLFVGILAGAAGQADWRLLAATAHWDAAPRGISIVFLSLVRARWGGCRRTLRLSHGSLRLAST